MMPYSEIKIDDIYVNRLSESGHVGYLVIDKNKEEKMIKLQPVNLQTLMPFMNEFWKKSQDRLFSEGNRWC